MATSIETLITDITSNNNVKQALAPHVCLTEIDVVVNITYEFGGFYVTITGQSQGRVLRGLDVDGSGESLLEALHALTEQIQDNL